MKKDKKFILVDLNDERAKQIAQSISNETSRKILDYLAGVEEASETEISKALNLPISTIHYNLKNLKSSGLVEVKQFSWSKKGKKIDYYRPAEKHIILSPSREGPKMRILKTILPIVFGLAIISIFLGLLLPSGQHQPLQQGINTFNSVDEIKEFIKDHKISEPIYERLYDSIAPTMTKTSMESADSAGGASDYSTTNIQVEGVDEADIIKNDGKYIYIISGTKLMIINAYPAGDMKILSEIKFENQPINLFVNKDRLIVFTNIYEQYKYDPIEGAKCPGGMEGAKCIPAPRETRTGIIIYDISDRKNPKIEEQMSISGRYFSSRMIGNYVYAISNQYINEPIIMPLIEKQGIYKQMEPQDIYYDNIKDYSFQNTIITAINIGNGETSEKAVLSGTTQEIYVSENNIYTIFTMYPNLYESIADTNTETTRVQKISINKDEIEHVATGEVSGKVLNQFSMDEFRGDFRIATTIGEVWNEETKSTNNIYILDEDMKTIGTLEGLAPGERIYSVRFMGEKGYVVTFKKVDPLFVIDLSNSENPKVLGKLKIPGYSDYLHPYDENHIIGIGKEAIDAEQSLIEQRNLDFAWYQGIKIALFDVSDVNNPIELHKVVIGDRGTDSEALYDHKAFLFSKEKELLAIPITLAEIKGEKSSDNQYGEHTFQGAFVYKINLEDGFVEQGRITHYSSEDYLKMGRYFYGDKNIRRSLYMDDTLYTISTTMIKANDLSTIKELNSISWTKTA
ncbi:MAG: beta-propeller domain-containing protein [Nanoarchaeota archaeon]|nr:beta-propeller domain-containing protein [Nanoarchaeota archaeon]